MSRQNNIINKPEPAPGTLGNWIFLELVLEP